MGPDTVPATMESVYRAWDEAIAAGDVSFLVNLYAADAEIESPLVYEFTKAKTGVLRGREEFRPFYQEVARRQSDIIRPRHHDGCLVRGRHIVWEYPRVTSTGNQSEFVESWDLNEDYEIQFHRVYWGWSRVADLSRKGFGPQPTVSAAG